MRAFLLLALMIGATMSAASADEPKKKADEKYPETITVRRWDRDGKKFLNPCEVKARRVEKDGKPTGFFIHVQQASGTGQPVKDSEITSADGAVWLVTKGSSTGQGEYAAVVVKKP